MESLAVLAISVVACALGAGAVWFGVRYGARGRQGSIPQDAVERMHALDVELAGLRERLAGGEKALSERTGELAKLQQALNDGTLALSEAKSAASASEASRAELEKKLAERMQDYAARQIEIDKARADHAALLERCAAAEKKLASAESAREEERRAFEARMEDLKNLRKEMEAAFAKLSGEALARSGEQFLSLANERLSKLNAQNAADLEKEKKAVESLVKPLGEALGRVGERVEAFDKNRAESFAQLAERIAALTAQEASLQKETSALGEALRKPNVRGAWGEMQLRRVVEFAGMVEHCHFDEQVAVSEADRPDMILYLPNGVSVVVDAKAPMQAYLEALQVTEPEKRAELMQNHVRQIRERAKKLAQKKYTSQLETTPDFTVLFLPTESLLSTALELEPALLTDAMKDKVILATPTTLIALLMAVAAGWQDRKVAENALHLKDECKALYDGVCAFLDHYESVGTNLEKAIAAYNKSVGSMQKNYLPKARRINEMGDFDKDGEKLLEATPAEVVETNARRLDRPAS